MFTLFYVLLGSTFRKQNTWGEVDRHQGNLTDLLEEIGYHNS